MANIFDENFEAKKAEFRMKFGKEWDSNPSLYMQYLQTLFLASLTDIANQGLTKVINRQEEILGAIQSNNKKM